MTQVATITQADGSGAAVRTGFNAIIEAIYSMNSGATEPNNNSSRAFTWWYDTTAAKLKLRNPADTAWIDVADVLSGPDRLRFYSENLTVLTTGATTFTGSITVDVSTAVGEITARSTLAAGVPSRFTLAGHDSAANDTVYGQISSSITDNTHLSEDADLIFATIVAGTLTTRLALTAVGGTFTGIFNATTLQQGGTTVQAMIDASIDSLDATAFSGALTLVQGDSGKARTFTGTGPFNVTVPAGLTTNSIIVIHNDGTATLTFIASGGTVFQNGVTLASGKSCTLIWLGSNKVRILGENA